MVELGHEPTLTDVAHRAGVSVTTVSRVLNNRGYLSQRTKDAVATAIKELHYRPNQVARALLGKRTWMVGVIVPTVAFPFFGEVCAGIEHALATNGYRMLLCNSFGRPDREREYLQLLAGNRVDGIISGAHNRAIPEYDTLRLPLVTVDRELSPTIPNVRAANEQGGRMATELLLKRGATRPGLLTSSSSPLNRREAGYRSVLMAADVEPYVMTVEFHTLEPDRTAEIFGCLDAAWAAGVDAVFCTDDLMAIAALNWASERGITVPDAFKVVGFDATLALRQAVTRLTTISQPIAQISARAVELLLEQIDARVDRGVHIEPKPVAPEEFPVTLIEGTTT